MKQLRARLTVEGMKEYHPPLGERTGLRLDFNENVAGCSQKVFETLRAISPEVLNKYPERRAGELAVAEKWGLAVDQLLLTNGVDEAIHLLCECYLEPEDEVVIPQPTFSMYELYASATGAKIVSAQCDANLEFPLTKILKAITPQTKMIVIANPNNPTGATADLEDLRLILRSAPQAAVLVDEAYYDFHGETMLGDLNTFDNLFVSRTFSKAYGLAGFRIGVLMGAPKQMSMVRRVGSPYSVNGVAIECLKAALSDDAYVAQYVKEVREGRKQLIEFYRKAGVACWPSAGNFVLARIGAGHAEFAREMERRGILVRDRNTDPGCAGCVRITLGSLAQTARLLAELPSALAAAGLDISAKEAL